MPCLWVHRFFLLFNQVFCWCLPLLFISFIVFFISNSLLWFPFMIFMFDSLLWFLYLCCTSCFVHVLSPWFHRFYLCSLVFHWATKKFLSWIFFKPFIDPNFFLFSYWEIIVWGHAFLIFHIPWSLVWLSLHLKALPLPRD